MRRYEVVPGPELIVEQGVTLNLTQPHTTPPGHVLTVDGIVNTPQLNVQGLLRGTGSVQAPVINRGTVSPGTSPGILSVTDFIQITADPNTEPTSGVLKIELGGTDNSDPQNPQFDQLLIAGNATLGGTLDVSLIFPFALTAGQSYEIVDVGGQRAGTFNGLAELGFVGRYGVANLFITYLGGDGNDVTLLSALPGDFDVDGDVDGLDFLKWQKGESPRPRSRSDLADWEVNYGMAVPPPPASTVVPEPAAASLFAVALALCSWSGGRRRRQLAQVAAATAVDCRMERESRSTAFTQNRSIGKLPWLAPLVSVVVMVGAGEALATMITLAPVRDNTLIEKADGSLSNGAGSYMFAGRTDASSDNLRRVVMAFDIAGNVPAGSTIQSVTLTLTMSRTKVGAMTFDLRRLTSDWGEGASNADAQEGGGIAAAPNDATWIHTFYPGSFWTTAGGDYAATVSGSASVGNNGAYNWGSTAQMVTDVQSWLDTPANNYGWILMGPENVRSAKRFNSQEHSTAATRPALVVEFVSGGPQIFNWIGTGSGGSFHDPNNWDTGQAPSSSTDIVYLVNNNPNYDQVATLSSSVTIDELTIDGNTNSMTLSIGQGLAANVGDLQFGSLGGLEIGIAAGAAGQLNASGPAALAGTLAFSTPGSLPAPTESFEIVSFASRTGIFDTIAGYEIDPNRSFSLHYNDSRALAIAGEWAASSEELTGEVDVPQELLVSGAWDWNGTLIKRGAGELVLDLDGGFSTGTGATLAIVDGAVRLQGTGQTLSLDALAYGELGALSGDSSLAGEYGWYGKVAVPEPGELVLVAVGLLWLSFGRSRVRVPR